MDLPEPYEKNSDDEANRCEGEEMRKPTREEVDERVASVRLEVMGVGEVMLSPATRKPIVDAVMALFEDKPKPKWEKDLSTYVKRNGLKSYDSECMTLHAEGLKDFIRKKLREMREDCHPDDYRAGPVKEKWGL